MFSTRKTSPGWPNSTRVSSVLAASVGPGPHRLDSGAAVGPRGRVKLRCAHACACSQGRTTSRPSPRWCWSSGRGNSAALRAALLGLVFDAMCGRLAQGGWLVIILETTGR